MDFITELHKLRNNAG